MRKIFVKNLILFQGLNLIIKPLWILLIDKEAQNLLGTAYADYYFVLNLSLVFNILLDIGIQSFNNASVASDPLFFKLNFKTILSLKLFLSFVYLAIVVSVGMQNKIAFNLLLIVAINQVLTSLILYLRTNINGLHHYTLDGILSVSDKFFGILICLALFFTNQISVVWFALAQLIASGITFVVSLFYNIKFYKTIQVEVHQLKQSLLQLLKKSIPYALLFTLMGMYTRADVIMMKWLLGDESIWHTSIYAQCFRLLDAAAMFAMLFAGLLLPMFSKMLKSNEDVRPLSHLATTILLPIAISVAVAAYFFPENTLYRLYDVYKKGADVEQLRYASRVFSNILYCFLPMCLTFIFSTLLTAKGDLKYLNTFALVALLTNFTLNYFLIPNYQSFGASISSLSTQTVFALLCIARCFHLFKFKIKSMDALKIGAFIICLVGASFVLKGMSNLLVIFVLFGFSALALLFLLRIINVHHVLNIFKKDTQ